MAKAKKKSAKRKPGFKSSDKEFEAMFNEEKKKEQAANFEDTIVPEGNYATVLTRSNAGSFDRNGSAVPFIGYNFSVADGPHQGASLSVMDTFDKTREVGIRIALGNLQRFDVDTSDMSPKNLEAELQEAASIIADKGLNVEVSVVHKEGRGNSKGQGPVQPGGLYQNVRIRRVLEN